MGASGNTIGRRYIPPVSSFDQRHWTLKKMGVQSLNLLLCQDEKKSEFWQRKYRYRLKQDMCQVREGRLSILTDTRGQNSVEKLGHEP